MKVGVHFRVTGHTIDPVTIATAVEGMGFDSFWVPDHTVLPMASEGRFPAGGEIPPVYGQIADPFVVMSFVAAATSTLTPACVCIVPERHPLTFAKSVSSLDRFARGRLLLGIGAGWMREEIGLFGVDFASRWTYTRETIEFCRKLWKDGVAGFEGKLLTYPELMCDPIPVQRPAGPPVILGGSASAATYRRIGQWADGWLAALATPEQVAAARASITEECERFDRDPSAIEISVLVMEADAGTQEAYAAAGADRLVVTMYNHPGTYVGRADWAAATDAAASSPPPTPDQTLAALERVRARAAL